MILDEPTAQLDVRGEAEIFERLLDATARLHDDPDLAPVLDRAPRRPHLRRRARPGRRARHARRADGAGGRYRDDVRAAGVARSTTPSEPSRARGASNEAACRIADDADLPPASAARCVARCVLAYRAEPRLLVISFVLMSLSWLPGRVRRAVAEAARRRRARAATTARSAGRAVGLAAAAAARLAAAHDRQPRSRCRFRDRATIEIEAHVARLQATVAELEHHERPDVPRPAAAAARAGVPAQPPLRVADRARSARSGGWSSPSALLDVGPPRARAARPRSRVPTVVVVDVAGRRRAHGPRRRPRRAPRLGPPPLRARHRAGPGKELRVCGIGDRDSSSVAATRGSAGTRRRRRARWTQRASGTPRRGRCSGSATSAPWSSWRRASTRRPATSCSSLAAGANLSRFLGVDRRRGRVPALDARRVAAAGVAGGLRRRARRRGRRAGARPARRRRSGSRTSSFRYPGTDRAVLEDVDLDLPAGSVVALVGENGAGKTTLVKLLCRFYDPTRGPHHRRRRRPRPHRPPAEWRARLSGAFQDFFRFEYRGPRTVGVGDLPRIDDRAAVGARRRAGRRRRRRRAAARAASTPSSAPTWHDGVELSVGQWQKLALGPRLHARATAAAACSTSRPPPSTPRPSTRCSSASPRASRAGAAATAASPCSVSHRFSTVRMADLIVVLDGGRVVEHGSHDELVAARRPLRRALRAPGPRLPLTPNRDFAHNPLDTSGLSRSPQGVEVVGDGRRRTASCRGGSRGRRGRAARCASPARRCGRPPSRG